MTRAARRDLGIELIVSYKFVKAVGEIALAVLLIALASAGELHRVRELALALRNDVTSRWAVLAGRALSALFSARGVRLVEAGLALDGVLSAVEGWSLWRRYTWGPWLVVVATGGPLPLEIAELVRRPSAARLALALANAAVVGYLARRIRTERGRAPSGRAARR